MARRDGCSGLRGTRQPEPPGVVSQPLVYAHRCHAQSIGPTPFFSGVDFSALGDDAFLVVVRCRGLALHIVRRSVLSSGSVTDDLLRASVAKGLLQLCVFENEYDSPHDLSDDGTLDFFFPADAARGRESPSRQWFIIGLIMNPYATPTQKPSSGRLLPNLPSLVLLTEITDSDCYPIDRYPIHRFPIDLSRLYPLPKLQRTETTWLISVCSVPGAGPAWWRDYYLSNAAKRRRQRALRDLTLRALPYMHVCFSLLRHSS